MTFFMNDCIHDTARFPMAPATALGENATDPLKPSLTLFLPPNLGFGESFCASPDGPARQLTIPYGKTGPGFGFPRTPDQAR
jgi:hypothetical protein